MEKWHGWLADNSKLFAALEEGAQIGITQNLQIILEFDEQVAKDWQWKKNKEETIIFLRHRAQIGRIQTYFLKKEDILESQGFLDFLRTIGLRTT